MVTEFTDLPNTDLARIEAAKRIGVLLLAHAGKLWADEEWQMDVTDDTGLILFVINVAALRSPATERPAWQPREVTKERLTKLIRDLEEQLK